MTDFLTISDGVTTLVVDVSAEGGASERESRRVGETVETGTGTLASSVEAEFREWDFTAAMMAAADYETLRAFVALDRRRTVAGNAIDATGGPGLTCIVRATAGPYVRDDLGALGFRRRVALHIRQAE